MQRRSETKSRSRLCNKNYCKRASSDQKLGLIKYLEENPDVSRKNYETMVGSIQMHNKWKEIAVLLNNYKDGGYKNAMQWRRYWMDTMKQTRKKLINLSHKADNKIILENRVFINNLDERIITLMSKGSPASEKDTNDPLSTQNFHNSATDSEDNNYNEDNSDTYGHTFDDDEQSQANRILEKNLIDSETNFSKSKDIRNSKYNSKKIYCDKFRTKEESGSDRESRRKRVKTYDSDDETQNLFEAKIAIEKDRIKALKDISSSIRYLADVIGTVMNNKNQNK